MKRFTTFIFCLITGILYCLDGNCRKAEDGTIKVLAIGNSFSVDAIEQNLWELGQADGVTFVIGDMFIGECSLERHAKNSRNGSADYRYCKIGADGVKTFTDAFTLEEALGDEDWDFISLQ